MIRTIEALSDSLFANFRRGIPKNMFEGISQDMMQNVVQGKSPLCAIEKRIANGKMMIFNVGKTLKAVLENSQHEEHHA